MKNAILSSPYPKELRVGSGLGVNETGNSFEIYFTGTLPSSSGVFGTGTPNAITVWENVNTVTGYENFVYNNPFTRVSLINRENFSTGSVFAFQKERGSGGAVLAGDSIGVIDWESQNGSGFQKTARLEVAATQDHSPLGFGSRFSFHAVRNNGISLEEAMRVTAFGVGILTNVIEAPLSVVRNDSFNSQVIDAASYHDSNTVVPVLRMSRFRPDTNPAGAGFGASIRWRLEGFFNNSLNNSAEISSAWEENLTSGSSSLTSNFSFSTIISGSFSERMRISSSGDIWNRIPHSSILSSLRGRGIFVTRDASSGFSGGEYIVQWNSTGTQLAGLRGVVGSGNASSPNQTLVNQGVGLFLNGWDSVPNYISSSPAVFLLRASENWQTSALGTYAAWELTPTGSSVRTERMRLTGEGRLGINTASPQAILHTVQPAADYTVIFENNVSDNTPHSIIQMRRTRSDATAPGAGFGAGMVAALEGFTNGSLVEASAIRTIWEVNQTNDTTDRDSAMVFMTMQDNVLAERMRLTSGGRLGINFVPSNASPAITTITPNAAGSDLAAVFTSNRNANGITWVISRHVREDATAPDAFFGAGFLAQLEGFTNNSITDVGWISWQWLNNQTNDTTDRNSFFTLALNYQGTMYNQAVWMRGSTDFYSNVAGGAHTLGIINSAGSGFRRSEVRFSVFDGSSSRPLFGIFAESNTNPTTDQMFTIYDWVANASRLRIYNNGTLAFGQHLITPSVFTVTWNGTEWPVRARVSHDTATARTTFHCQRSRGTLTSPSAVLSGDYIGGITAGGHDGVDWRDGWNGGAEIIMYATQNWSNTARGAGIQFLTTPNGGTLSTTRMTLHNGLQVGAPTGGDMGVGTINVSGNIYRNGSAYTHPDFVFEKWLTGKIEKFAKNERAEGYELLSLEEVEDYVRKNFRLPRIGDEPTGIFTMMDISLEKIEELFIHLIELQKRVKALEKRL